MAEHFIEAEKLLHSVWPEWKVVNIIGAGTYGDVYEIAKSEDMRAALKIISIPSRSEREAVGELAAQNDQLKREYAELTEHLKSEMMFMDRLKHVPNIVSMEDYAVIDAEDGVGYNILMRMELLRPLRDLNPMSEDSVIKLGIDISSALMICKEEKILHRDIKPGNILYNRYGEFKLGDFGIARVMDVTTRTLTRKMGSPMYMAPEVVLGKAYDFRSDIYSLGLVMYVSLNDQKLPFIPAEKKIVSIDEREDAYIRRMNGEELPPPAHASPELTEIIRKACQADPKERYSDASEIHNALSELRAHRKGPDIESDKNKYLKLIGLTLSALLAGAGIGAAIHGITIRNKTGDVVSDFVYAQSADAETNTQKNEIQMNEASKRDDITSVKIIEPPTRTLYNVGDTLDISGLKIKVECADGSTYTTSLDDLPTETVFVNAGIQPVSLLYEGSKIEFEVRVSTPLVFEISDDESYCVVTGTVNPSDDHVIIPAQYQGKPVKEIGSSAFADSSMSKIDIPNTVEKIGEKAFYNCVNLKEINLPSSVNEIVLGQPAQFDEGAGHPFQNCLNVEKITVDEHNPVYSGKGNCLIDKTSKTLIFGCRNSVIPEDGSVTNLGEGCFADLGLKKIVLPEGITGIQRKAFWNNDLRSLDLPSTLDYCSVLGFAYAGENLESITKAGDNSGETYVVNNCLIRRSEKKLLLGCKNSVIPDDGQVVMLGTACMERKGIESIILPDCISGGEGYVLSENYNLKSIRIPRSMHIPPEHMFFQCSSLESVVIPDTVTEIPQRVFEMCKSLKTVYYEGTEDQWDAVKIERTGNKYLLNAEVVYEYNR